MARQQPDRAGRVFLAALLGMAVVLASRLMVVASAGHLLFDANIAEYGYLRAIAPWIDVPLLDILRTPHLRSDFLHGCQRVGNQIHGSLGVAGLSTLVVVKLTGMPLSTTLIRGLGVVQSMLSLMLWCRALGTSTRSARVVFAFCLLWALAPLTFLKISMLWWGTHDTVTLLASAWAALLLPWMARPVRGGAAWGRAAVLGCVGGVLVLGNYAVLLPVVGGLGFWLGAGLLRAMVQRDRRELMLRLGAVGIVAGMLLTTVQFILGSGVLDGLGYPNQLQFQHYLLLSGKSGQPFLHSVSTDWMDLSRWQALVWPVALRQSPGTAYGLYAQSAEASVRIGAMVMGAGLVLRWLWGLGRPTERGRGDAWIGAYLVLGVLAVGTLSLGTSPDVGGRASPQPRYFAHLYPFAMAVMAVVCAAPRRRLLPAVLWPAVLVWPLWLGWFDQQRLLDVAVMRDRMVDGYRVEVAPLFWRVHGERPPPEGYLVWPHASDAFLEGYAVLENFQHRNYWRWLEPGDVANSREISNRLEMVLSPSSPDDPDFARGVGVALRVLIPPSRSDVLTSVMYSMPISHAHVLEGYEQGGPLP